ncbi:MAG: effector-binding domain-containing protein/uncharacterized protein YndB with AHSA1/START domain [Saprospiraceae bacterium]|jgi:effector-binding domain-containing protein/uncharacterized protein YndB with AHSA1/START domain
MKYLLYLFGLIAAIVLLYIGLCALGPKNFDLIRSTEIDAPAPVVFNLINSFKQMDQWNAWSVEDTTNKVTYNDILSGVGAESTWDSEVNDKGRQKIIESIPNQKIRTELEFEGWNGLSHAEFNLSPEKGKTNVSWAMESGDPLPFAFRGFALLSGMKKSIKRSYDDGLVNLKKIAEERANESIYEGYQIKELILEEKNYVMNRQEVQFDKIQQFYASNLGVLFSKVQAAGVEMTGMPCGLFFRYDESKGVADMASAIPVGDPINIEGASAFNFPSKKAIQVDFYGDYSQTGSAHQAIDLYMADRGYLQDVPLIEEYITDPTIEKDPSKWLTRVTYYFSERG